MQPEPPTKIKIDIGRSKLIIVLEMQMVRQQLSSFGTKILQSCNPLRIVGIKGEYTMKYGNSTNLHYILYASTINLDTKFPRLKIPVD